MLEEVALEIEEDETTGEKASREFGGHGPSAPIFQEAGLA